MSLGRIDTLDPFAYFPLNRLGNKQGEKSLKFQILSWVWRKLPGMRKQDGDAERTGFSQTLPAQTCFRQTEHFTRTGFLLYSSQPFGLKSAG